MSGPHLFFVGAVFLLEAMLITLALVHRQTGRFARTTLWVTRVLVVGSVVASMLATYSVLWEIRTFDYPWTLPGRPFGTYARPTILGVGMIAVHAVLFILAAAAAAVDRRRAAVILLGLVLLTSVPGALNWLTDETAPPNNMLIALVVGPTFPALTIAALLASLSVPLFGSPRR
jgi:hypothetical protein